MRPHNRFFIQRIEQTQQLREEVPYSDDRELLNDVSRQGREVEALAAASLREKTAQEARAIVAIYSR
jgi:predicted DNA-binding transcriptional regulator YafY